MSMLNWRRDPDYERRMHALRIDRMRIENEILRVQSDSEQIVRETEQIEKETEQIEKETEQLRAENARLRALNARTKHLISCVDQACFPPESNSIPVKTTKPD